MIAASHTAVGHCHGCGSGVSKEATLPRRCGPGPAAKDTAWSTIRLRRNEKPGLFRRIPRLRRRGRFPIRPLAGSRAEAARSGSHAEVMDHVPRNAAAARPR